MSDRASSVAQSQRSARLGLGFQYPAVEVDRIARARPSRTNEVDGDGQPTRENSLDHGRTEQLAKVFGANGNGIS